jgi:hypothetical protein
MKPTNTPKMTQKQAYEYNDKQGTRMVNTQDLIKIKDKEFFKTLNKEMVDDFFLSGTRIEYKDNLMATITPHKGKPITIKVPYVQDKFNPKDKEQVAFLKALFGENAISLVKRLAKGKPIYLWTPNQEYRNKYPTRAVRLYFGEDRFNIFGFNCFSGSGFSHSVSIDSAKQSISNPKKSIGKEILQIEKLANQIRKKGYFFEFKFGDLQ